jgi:peptidoglycan/xylan/chitin deacetylase (PgdA/CDA1 family)
MALLRAVVRDVAAALLYGSGLTRPARAAADQVVVVTFHRVLPRNQIAEYPSPEIAVTPEELRWFLQFFGAHYTCGPLAETMERFTAGERPARPWLAITFDDGHGDNHTHARGVLAESGLRASFFVVPEALEARTLLWPDRLGYAVRALLDRRPAGGLALLTELGVGAGGDAGAVANRAIANAKQLDPDALAGLLGRLEAAAGPPAAPRWDRLMTWNEVLDLAKDGHEIGSHSCSHPILTHCNATRLEHEASASRRHIAGELGREIASFCYPNGDHDDRVVGAVERAGYRWAVTTRWGLVDHASPPLRLHRCDIQGASARGSLGRLSERRMAWRLSRLHRAG